MITSGCCPAPPSSGSTARAIAMTAPARAARGEEMAGTVDRGTGEAHPGLLAIAEDCLATLALALAAIASRAEAPPAAATLPAAPAPAPALAPAPATPAPATAATELRTSRHLDPAQLPPGAPSPERLSPNAVLIADHQPPDRAPQWRVYHRPRHPQGPSAQPFEFRQAILMDAPIADFLCAAYRGLLRRDPDWDGYAHYRARITEGRLARHEALKEIATSDEARRLDIELLILATDAPSAPEPA